MQKLDLSHWLIIPKREIALWAYILGIFIVYYGSLAPWFAWKIFSYEQYIAFFPIAFSMLYSQTLNKPLFTRKDYLLPTIAFAVCVMVMCMCSGKNMNGYISEVFRITIFMSLFMLDTDDLSRIGNILSKSMAIILAPSIIWFILYLVGFPLPHSPITPHFSDYYSYENYYLFMIDDREFIKFFPRFNSVFLEPSHLAMACIALLMTQVGQWRRFSNIVLFVALVLSFSLAGYIFLIIILFSASWMKRKAILRKVLFLVAFFVMIGIASVFYNDGDNLVNELILQRLAVNDDGEIEGNNRVSEGFDAVYEDFVRSDQVLTGAGLKKIQDFQYGNAGYKVFIYTNGLISVFFLILFFITLYFTATNRQGAIIMLLIHFVSFIPHGIPIKFYFFIPLYILAFRKIETNHDTLEGEKQNGLIIEEIT
jgi:ABC-type multidrug transport system fused ATPase/permease subunit